MIILTETNKWRLQNTSRRIPAAVADEYIQGCELLSHVQEIAEQSKKEAEQLKAKASAQGYQDGLEKARQELLQGSLEAVEEIRNFQKDRKQNTLAVSIALVQRLLPALDSEKVLSLMLERVFRELLDERQLYVYVHPDHQSLTEAYIKHWRQGHPGIGRLQVLTDDKLSRQACRVETELGLLIADPAAELADMQSRISRTVDQD